MKKILIVTSHSYTSGVETHCFNLVEELIKRGFEVEALAPVEGPWVERVRKLGVPVHVFNFYQHYWRRVWGLVTIMRRGHYDVVHNHAFTRIALVAAKLAGIKRCICTVHVGGIGKSILSGASRFGLTNRLMDCFVDHYIANSETTRQELRDRHIASSKISVIYLGLDRKFFSCPVQPRKIPTVIRIGALGRLEVQKGFSFLIEACHYLTFPFVCLIGGSGSLYPVLQQQIKDLNLESRVFLSGEVESLEFYHHIDIFVLSSIFESFGLVVPEAAACRLPIVAADLPVVEELKKFVPQIITFQICNPHDLAEKLNQTSHTLDRMIPQVEENFQTVRRLNLDTMTDQIVKIYQITPSEIIHE